jgi:hypothetical protein
MSSPAPHGPEKNASKLALAARRWWILAAGLLKHALKASVFIVLSLAAFTLWWYLRLFACWASLEDWSRYLCDLDFFILVAAALFACLAFYFALKPIRTGLRPRRRSACSAIAAALIFLLIVCVVASPIRFALFN